jgi:hypothetical protein
MVLGAVPALLLCWHPKVLSCTSAGAGRQLLQNVTDGSNPNNTAAFAQAVAQAIASGNASAAAQALATATAQVLARWTRGSGGKGDDEACAWSHQSSVSVGSRMLAMLQAQ